MSNPLIPVADPFAIPDEDMPEEQAAAKRLVEGITQRSALPFEAEKQLVNQDHNNMQRQIWGEHEDDRHPVELPTSGA